MALREEDATVNLTQPHQSFAPACAICFERTKTTTAHALCALECGHTFGLSCVKAWIARASARGTRAACPVCDTDAREGDIRLLFVHDCAEGDEDEEVEEEDDKDASAWTVEDRADAEIHRARAYIRLLREQVRVLRKQSAGDEPRQALVELNRQGKRATTSNAGTKTVADFFKKSKASKHGCVALGTYKECAMIKGGQITPIQYLMGAALTRDGRGILQLVVDTSPDSLRNETDGSALRLVKRGFARGSTTDLFKGRLRVYYNSERDGTSERPSLFMLPKRHGATVAKEIVAICALYEIILLDVCCGRKVAHVSINDRFGCDTYAINTALWLPGPQNVLRVFVSSPRGAKSASQTAVESRVLEYDFNSDSYRFPKFVSHDIGLPKMYKNVVYFSRPALYLAASEIECTNVEHSTQLCEVKCQRVLQAHPSSNRVVRATWSETPDLSRCHANLTMAEWVQDDGGQFQLVDRHQVGISDFRDFYERSYEPAHDCSSNICMGVLPDRTEIMVVCRRRHIEIFDISTAEVIQEIDVGNCCLIGVDVSADASMFTVRYRVLDDRHDDMNFERHKLYKRVHEK